MTDGVIIVNTWDLSESPRNTWGVLNDTDIHPALEHPATCSPSRQSRALSVQNKVVEKRRSNMCLLPIKYKSKNKHFPFSSFHITHGEFTLIFKSVYFISGKFGSFEQNPPCRLLAWISKSVCFRFPLILFTPLPLQTQNPTAMHNKVSCCFNISTSQRGNPDSQDRPLAAQSRVTAGLSTV